MDRCETSQGTAPIRQASSQGVCPEAARIVAKLSNVVTERREWFSPSCLDWSCVGRGISGAAVVLSQVLWRWHVLRTLIYLSPPWSVRSLVSIEVQVPGLMVVTGYGQVGSAMLQLLPHVFDTKLWTTTRRCDLHSLIPRLTQVVEV